MKCDSFDRITSAFEKNVMNLNEAKENGKKVVGQFCLYTPSEIAIAAGAIVMIAGYTSAAGLLYGWKAAPVEFVTDIIQTGMGTAFALLFTPILRRRLALTETR